MNRRGPLTVALAIVALMAAASAWAWTQLPEGAQVPVHWSLGGTPDAYADKLVGLWLLPAVALVVALLFAVIPAIEPRRANLERSAKPYRVTWIGVSILFAVIHAVAVGAALGATVDVTRIVLGALGILFVAIGNYMPKVRPNYLVGIRTPWTLTSDLAWTRTHRLGGRLFVLEGIALVALAILGLGGSLLGGGLIAGIAVVVGIMFVYSYLVWRTDTARRSF